MSWTPIQTVNFSPGTADVHFSVPISATGAGHLLICTVYWDSSATSWVGISGGGDTYLPCGTQPQSHNVLGGNADTRVYYVTSTIGGNTAVVFDFSGTNIFPTISISEYSGQYAGGPCLDQVRVGTGTTSPTSSGNVTPITGGELIFGYCTNDQGGGAAGSGFNGRGTVPYDVGLYEMFVEDLTQAVAAPIAATSTYASGGNCVTSVMTFLPAGYSPVIDLQKGGGDTLSGQIRRSESIMFEA